MRLILGILLLSAYTIAFADMPARKDPVVLQYLKDPAKAKAKVKQCADKPPAMHTQEKIECWQASSAIYISSEPVEVQALILDERKFEAAKARCKPLLQKGKTDDQECKAYKKASSHLAISVPRPSLTGGMKF